MPSVKLRFISKIKITPCAAASEDTVRSWDDCICIVRVAALILISVM